MKDTDLKDVLGALPLLKARQPKPVTREELLAKATAMARRGYVHNADTLKVLETYLQGFGILLSGGVGIGKTYFFKKVNPEPLAVLSFNVAHLWKYEQLADWLDEHRYEEIVLDDIGWDADKATNYGQRFETLQVALDDRLNRSTYRTHITTNLTNDELLVKYDVHLVDRVYELCKCFALASMDSRREATPNGQYFRDNKYKQERGKYYL